MSTDVNNLIKEILKRDPYERIKLSEIVQHQWIKRMARECDFNLEEFYKEFNKMM